MIRTFADGENYLDVIRRRITEMGNTLGFVRMIKNASLKDNQNLLIYLPSILDTIKFEEIGEDLNIGGEVFESMKMFDESVRLMKKQGEDANDYMRKFIESNAGFADANESLAPLKNFYTMVPALTTAFIEHCVRGRAKLKQTDI
jgi:WASH complex subunit 7